MANVQIDVEGLSEMQIQRVKDYIAFLRLSGDNAAARTEIQRLWQKWVDTAPKMTDDEAYQLAEEALTEVRAKKK